MKLHLGCGRRQLPGWVHIDAQPFPHLDYQTDITKLSMIEDESVDELYACHVLEHIGRRELLATLREWNRVLQPGGKLRIAVPDFEATVAEYIDQSSTTLWQLIGLLTGGQRDALDHHQFVFDFNLTRALLECCGFREVKRYDWRDFLPPDFDDYSRSYLPHMDEENGRLMSLNVVATKCGEPATVPREVRVAVGETPNL
jgi:predicted SAM-dependent methyltransferase